MFIQENADFINRGKCKEVDPPLEPNDFFDKFEKKKKEEKVEFLVKTCYVCDVQNECFEYGKKTRAHGLWGGKFLEAGKVSRDTLRKQYREAERDAEAKINAIRLNLVQERANLSKVS